MEEEWLSQMQPDLSPYVTRVETLKLIADKTGSLENSSHSHENMNVLDQITNSDFTLISGLQQFEDSTNESIHTLNEGLANINGTAHTHGNKAVLDSFTKADKAAIDSLPQFKQGVNDDISELRESVSTVVEQAHWHHNLTVLNGITSAKIAKWDSATEWQLQFRTLQGNVMDYQMQMNHRMDQTDETVTEIQSDIQQLRDSNFYEHQNMNDAVLQLSNRLQVIETDMEEIDKFLSRIVG